MKKRASSIIREFRAIPNEELPKLFNRDTGEYRELTDQELSDKNMIVVYRGRSNTIVHCLGQEGDEFPGIYISGGIPRPFSGNTRRQQLFKAMKEKLPSKPEEVKVNSGFDALTEGSQVGEDEFRVFESHVPQIDGNGDK